MSVDLSHYHGWDGKLGGAWWSIGSIVRTALIQVFRRRAYWFVLALALLNFLLYFAVIYAVTQLPLPPPMQRNILKEAGFTADPSVQTESGFARFIDGQGKVVMVLLAFSGSLLVGNDFRRGSMSFYLSRGIDRPHYIIGKLVAVAAVIWLITVAPALVLYIEYGLFTSSFDFWIDNSYVLGGVLGYGTVLAVVLSILLTTCSAYLQRTAPIAVVWTSLFLLLAVISGFLRRGTHSIYWRLLDLWADMKNVGLLFFGKVKDHPNPDLIVPSIVVLSTVCTLALIALVWRVRAVEVVE